MGGQLNQNDFYISPDHHYFKCLIITEFSYMHTEMRFSFKRYSNSDSKASVTSFFSIGLRNLANKENLTVSRNVSLAKDLFNLRSSHRVLLVCSWLTRLMLNEFYFLHDIVNLNVFLRTLKYTTIFSLHVDTSFCYWTSCRVSKTE
jgi:hypothetical protein